MLNSEEVMADLMAFVRQEISSPKTGDACAKALLRCFGLNFRHQTIYVPNQTQRLKEISERNEAVIREFNGRNHNELALKYRVSLQTVYKIIRESRQQAETGEKPLKPILLFVIDEYLPPDLTRAGLDETEAKNLSQKVADYLCENYAGTMFHMVDVMKAK